MSESVVYASVETGLLVLRRDKEELSLRIPTSFNLAVLKDEALISRLQRDIQNWSRRFPPTSLTLNLPAGWGFLSILTPHSPPELTAPIVSRELSLAAPARPENYSFLVRPFSEGSAILACHTPVVDFWTRVFDRTNCQLDILESSDQEQKSLSLPLKELQPVPPLPEKPLPAARNRSFLPLTAAVLAIFLVSGLLLSGYFSRSRFSQKEHLKSPENMPGKTAAPVTATTFHKKAVSPAGNTATDSLTIASPSAAAFSQTTSAPVTTPGALLRSVDFDTIQWLSLNPHRLFWSSRRNPNRYQSRKLDFSPTRRPLQDYLHRLLSVAELHRFLQSDALDSAVIAHVHREGEKLHLVWYNP